MTGFRSRRRRSGFAFAAVSAASAAAFASTINWNGGTGSWTTPSQWDIARAPVAGDEVTISAGLTLYDLAAGPGGIGIENFRINGGNLVAQTAGNTLSIHDFLALTAGSLGGGININFTAAPPVPAAYSFDFGQTSFGGPAVRLSGATVSGDSVRFNRGNLTLSGHSANTINATSLFTVFTDARDITPADDSTLTINSTGNFVTSSFPNGTRTFNGTKLVSTNTITINAGTLLLAGINGDSGEAGGTITLASGGALVVNDFLLHSGTRVAGLGTLVVNGTLARDPPVAGAATVIDTLDLFGTIEVGDMDAVSSLILRPGSAVENAHLTAAGTLTNTLQTTATLPFTLRHSTLTSDGLTWTGPGNVLIDGSTGGSTIEIASSFSFSPTTGQTQRVQFVSPLSPNGLLHVGAGGSLTVAGGGTAILAVPVENDGVVNVSTGTLQLNGGGRSTGPNVDHPNGSTLSVAAGGTLIVAGQPFVLDDGVHVANAGALIDAGYLSANAADIAAASLRLDGFELNLRGDLHTNAFTWISGAITGFGTTRLSTSTTFTHTFGVGHDRVLLIDGGRSLTLDPGATYDAVAIGANVFGESGYAGFIKIGETGGAGSFVVNTPIRVGTNDYIETAVEVGTLGTLRTNPGATNAVTVAANVTNAGTVQIASGTLTIEGQLDSTARITGGVLDVSPYGRVNLLADSTTNVGRIEVRGNANLGAQGVLGVSDSAAVTASGGINANAGAVTVSGSPSFAGVPTLTIGNGGALTVNGSALAEVNVTLPTTVTISDSQVSVQSPTITGQTAPHDAIATTANLSISNAQIVLTHGRLLGSSVTVNPNAPITLSMQAGTFGRTNPTADLDIPSVNVGGTGTLSGNVTAVEQLHPGDFDSVTPGNFPGELHTTGGLNLQSTAILTIDLYPDQGSPTEHDTVSVAGELTLGGYLMVRVQGQPEFIDGNARLYIIPAATVNPASTIDDLFYDGDPDNHLIALFDGLGSDIVGYAHIALDNNGGEDGLYLFNPVPEPAAISLLPLIALSLRRRRRN